MLKLGDADVHGAIVRTLLEAMPLPPFPTERPLTPDDFRDAEFVPILPALGPGVPDPAVLEWTAHQGRVLLTNDRSTLIGHAYQRVERGQAMPGVIVMPPHHWRIGKALDDVLLIANVCEPEELRDQVVYLPLKPGALPALNPQPPSGPPAEE